MSKFNALSLIGQDIFEGDVVDKSGRVLFACGEEITPEKLLQLYFKEVSYREPQKPVLPNMKNYSFEDDGYDGFVDRVMMVTKKEEKEDSLIFDRTEAALFSKVCEKTAETLDFESKQIENARDAGYFFKIGSVKLTKDDLHSLNYDEKLANASSAMLEDMKMTYEVVSGVKDMSKPYEPEFVLSKPSNFPIAHIVAICNYWGKLRKRYPDKDECLSVLRQQGGRKFNIFVLHKLINYLRVNYE